MSCNVINSQGFGQYIEGFPCPYDSVMDPGAQLQPIMTAMGMSGLNCGCGCGGACPDGFSGLTMDGTGLFGTGLFAGGMDFSTWSIGEWLVVLFGVYAMSSLVGDTKRGYSRVSKGIRRRRKKAVAA